MLMPELKALPKGTKVNPKVVFADEPNYIHRADKIHSLRLRLTRLSEQGFFRMIADDEWERM